MRLLKLADNSNMIWMTIGAGIFGGWVLLLILSSERRHRVEVLVTEAARLAKADAEKPPIEVR